jgi:hypothetical protein
LSPAFRHGFANVNRKLIGRAIEFRVSRIKRIRAGVINRINAPPQKRNRRRQRQNGRAVKKTDGIFDQLCECVVSINVLRPIKWPLFHCECSNMLLQVCAGNLSASIRLGSFRRGSGDGVQAKVRRVEDQGRVAAFVSVTIWISVSHSPPFGQLRFEQVQRLFGPLTFSNQ